MAWQNIFQKIKKALQNISANFFVSGLFQNYVIFNKLAMTDGY
jgi:hypothetical protein